MTGGTETIRIVIPLSIRRRNGRPRILAPVDVEPASEPPALDPRLLRAIARAWDWRRRLERGDAATLTDIAQADKVTVSFVSRFLRLAYLSPTVLERLMVHRQPCALTIDQLATMALSPWIEQPPKVFDE